MVLKCIIKQAVRLDWYSSSKIYDLSFAFNIKEVLK